MTEQIEQPTATIPGPEYDSGAAEFSLKKLKNLEQEIAEIQSHAETERSKIEAWAEARITVIENQMLWHKNSLEAFTHKTGKKTVKLINGTIKKIAPRLSIEVVDEQAIPEEFFKRTEKISPDKKRILDHLKTTGEIVNGVELNEGEVNYIITTR